MMNVDKNGNRGKVCKVEVPIGFLKMHLKVSHSLGRKFKDFNGIILNCGGSGGDSKDQEFCLKEQVKDNSDCVGIIIKPEEGLREDIAATFSDNPDIVAVYVYCKVDKSVVVDGVIKVISPKVVFGHKDYLKDKFVNNFHNYVLHQALQFVVCELVNTKDKVLYSFTKGKEIDVDGLGMMVWEC